MDVAKYALAALVFLLIGLNCEAEEKVDVTLYMESLCPYCKKSIIQVLHPLYKQLSDIMDLSFVVYGNAREWKVSDEIWIFQCQHGLHECAGNVLENCMQHFVKDKDTEIDFMLCLESNDPSESGLKCAQKLNVTKVWPKIEQCSKSVLGNKLLHAAAVKTGSLIPKHTHVPWLIVNGKHNLTLDGAPFEITKRHICNAYKGIPPKLCQKV